MIRRRGTRLLALCACAALAAGCARSDALRVGAKTFTESEILAALVRQTAVRAGAEVEPPRSFLGTAIVYQALLNGEVDVYVDYVGTLSKELLARENLRTEEEVRAALAKRGIVMSRSLGFQNTYALGMREARAAELGIRSISQLRDHPQLVFRFSTEFMEREDGWPQLQRHYRLPQEDVRGIDHALAYEALRGVGVDVIDVYSTDAKIRSNNVRVLEDDAGYFPSYDAVILYRAELEETAPRVVAALRAMEGTISADEMRKMNVRVDIDGQAPAQAAREFLGAAPQARTADTWSARLQRIAARTREHLFLVVISLTAAVVVAVPLGVAAGKRPALGQAILAVTGVLQTVPSLALLALLMVPLAFLARSLPDAGFRSTGPMPAIIALFLYSLLPIVRNTATGLRGIPRGVRESAEAIGLAPLARLRLVELPLASPMILAGIKTAAVLNIGFATLGAIISAGGYGQPILTGITRQDYALISEGALSAAAMALVAQGLFEVVERWLVPRGLRLKK